jgi:hypothetical protein
VGERYSRTGETVLILTPSRIDSAEAGQVLREAGIHTVACSDIDDFCRRLSTECGAAMISEESLFRDEVLSIQQVLERQPSWSDIPIILLTNADAYHATEMFSKSGNISLLERPFSRLTLIRSVEVALRARRKQYQTRQLLNDLEKAKDEAVRANLAKSQFLANMSHEIRTPVGAVLGFTELMKSPESDPEDVSKFMGIVERNSRHLLRLIDDILDLSKVESGKMSVEATDVCLPDLLADLISMMRFKTEDKGIALEVVHDTKIPEHVLSDPVRLRQILSNVIGNAIKFTDKGSVRVAFSYAHSVLRVEVRDTGAGIADWQRGNLFKAFSQADSSTTRKFGGTGLGLVLSRRLAEAMGGRLELVGSAPGRGSTFLIEVRMEPAEAVKPLPALAESSSRVLAGMKILLAEDSPDNQALVQAYLGRTGVNMKVADNGREAVTLALGEEFDLVLMDIQMPVMDGHEATRKLRENHYDRPVIALTAHAMLEERSKCIAMGFSDFLPKPLERDKLLRTLEQFRNH